jgi:hypothetical protein
LVRRSEVGEQVEGSAVKGLGLTKIV